MDRLQCLGNLYNEEKPIMKAKLLPLKGKYYGTELIIEYDNGKEYYIKLWGGDVTDEDNYKPSEREVENARQWAEEGDDILEYIDCSHMESVTTYRIAKKIMEAIEG